MGDIVEDLIRVAAEWADGCVTDHDLSSSNTVHNGAKEIERLRAALQFYVGSHRNPNDGPYGVNSTDFGSVARRALEAGDPYYKTNLKERQYE